MRTATAVGMRAAGPGVADPDVIVRPDEKAAVELDKPWNVIVHNDPVNLMQFVTMVLQKVFGYSRQKAEEMMMAVHQKGKCIVWTGIKEPAEHYTHQLQAWQLQASMQKTD